MGHALSMLCLKLGLPKAIASFARALLTAEGASSIGNMVMPSGSDSGANFDKEVTSSSSGNWRQYLNLSEEEGDSAPEASTARAPNQVPAAEGRPSSNPSASRGEEAGPSNRTPPVVPYPYQPDEVIGGDSVESIQRRLLAKYSCPSAEVIRQAEIEAQDLFEVKVEIIRVMAGLDPTGDWMGRGAQALENPRTATGEESLEKLYTLKSNLEMNGVRSEAFSQLKKRVPPK